MPGMITPPTINESDLLSLVNSTSMAETVIRVNHTVYGGMLIFLLLVTLFIILFISFQRKENQLLTNLMYSSAIVTLLSFIYRAIVVIIDGTVYGLITDAQMWLFPIISSFLAMMLYLSKKY